MRILPLIICLAFPATSHAELRTIGVLLTKDNQAHTRVSIASDVRAENKTNTTVKDAIPVLRHAKGWGSSVKVGVVVRDVPLAEYLPLLAEISNNSALELVFLEGEKPSFVHANIRKRIEAAYDHPQAPDPAKAKDADE